MQFFAQQGSANKNASQWERLEEVSPNEKAVCVSVCVNKEPCVEMLLCLITLAAMKCHY